MISELSLVEQKALFTRASFTYHSTAGGDSPVNDEQFDELKRSITAKDPNWPPLKQAGWLPNPLSPLKQEPHVGFMGSIYNAYDYATTATPEDQRWHEGMKNWMKSHNIPVIGSLKVDGLSVALEYKDGQLQRALTRGDCITGENITHHVLLMRQAPAVIPEREHVVIRGEAVMYTNDWNIFHTNFPAYKNPRNAAAGIMGRKDTKHSSYLRFVAHDLQFIAQENPATYCDEMYEWMHEWGFEHAGIQLCQSFDDAARYFESIENVRNNLNYEIDGVVFRINKMKIYNAVGVDSGRCPRGAVAWKFPAAIAQTKLLDVSVTVGHTGVIAPTAVLAPVPIGGVTVSSASLANYDEIDRLGIGINDIVEIARQGDVIPKIIRMTIGGGLDRKNIERPIICPVCGGSVGKKTKVGGEDGALLYCLNDDCTAKSTGKINKWIADTGMLGIGKKIVEAMVDAKLVSDPADLYTLVEVELSEMPFGKSIFNHTRAGTAITTIQSKRSLPLNLFLGALGVPGLGEGVARNVREKAPGEFDKLTDWIGCTKIIDFADRIGLPNSARAIYEGLRARQPLVAKLLAVGVVIRADIAPVGIQKTAGGPLSSMVFCLTGSFPDKKSVYEEKIRQAGGGIEDDVRGNVTHVVVNEMPAAGKETGKSQKARKKGLTLLTWHDLNEVIMAGATFKQVSEFQAKRCDHIWHSNPALIIPCPACGAGKN